MQPRRPLVTLSLLYGAFAGALGGACASPGMPPGGPPDEEVPRVTRISPDSNALNVNASSVLIHFDEVISERPSSTAGRTGAAPAGGAATGLAAIVSISPSDGRERVNWRRTAIEIEPRRGFRPNTAYRVVIAPGVTDLRGNIIADRIEFVFSTGPSLATGEVHGVVFDWAAVKSAPHARVEVFPPNDSTLRWTTTADSLGRFTVRDLSPGQYLVRGWIDANGDRVVDRREVVASDTVSTEGEPVELYAFVQDTLAPRIETVEFADSLTLRVRFDRAVATDWDPAGAVTLVDSDSVARGIGELVPRERYDSLKQAAAAAASIDTTVAADTSVADTAVVDTARADTVAADTTVADTLAADSVVAPRFGRPAPIQVWVLPLDSALAPGRYRLTIRNVRGLNARAVTSDREFSVRAPAPAPTPAPTPRPAADTAATRADTATVSGRPR